MQDENRGNCGEGPMCGCGGTGPMERGGSGCCGGNSGILFFIIIFLLLFTNNGCCRGFGF